MWELPTAKVEAPAEQASAVADSRPQSPIGGFGLVNSVSAAPGVLYAQGPRGMRGSSGSVDTRDAAADSGDGYRIPDVLRRSVNSSSMVPTDRVGRVGTCDTGVAVLERGTEASSVPFPLEGFVQGRTLRAIRRVRNVIRRSPLTDDILGKLQAAFPVALDKKSKDQVAGVCHDEAGVALLAPETAPLRSLVDAWGKFAQLAKFIGDKGLPKAKLLMDYNDVFGLSALSPEVPKAGPPTTDQRLDLIGNMVAHIKLLTVQERDALRLVRQAAMGGMAYLVTRYHRAADPVRVLRIIAACQSTGGKLSLIPDDPVKLQEVEQVFAAYPPGAFAGFPTWGQAEAASPQANIREHCLKHVFYCFPPDKTAPPMDEIRSWWGEFKLTIKVAEVSLRAPGEVVKPEFTAAFGADHADKPELTVDPAVDDQVKLLGRLAAAHQSVADFLLSLCEKDFEARALALSTGMTEVQVHLFKGAMYMISGKNGHYYIVGRAQAGNPELSSAYWTADADVKVNAAKGERLWKIQ